MKLSPWAVILSVLAIVLFSISAVTYLVASNHPADQVLGLLTAIAAPTVVSLIALAKTEQVNSGVQQVNSDVQTVVKQTNGVLTDVQDRVSTLEEASPTPTPIPPPTDPGKQAT